MIVKIQFDGTSFSGLAAYLTHDQKQRETADRVAWTHTHNLANDHVPSAVDEMLWTARDAELLKQEAGVRAGGRATENPVKHVSLNWAPSDRPTQQHMVETAEEFLRHMKWQEHQAVFVAHRDKPYAHVHLILNAVHPETGLRLDDNFERRRAQAWAAEYEREQGRIHCEQRLKEPHEREKSPPRDAWMVFRGKGQEFERAESSLEQNTPNFTDDPKNRQNAEWKMLKQIQRDEREAFFAGGKSEYSKVRASAFREIREEFRERWSDHYTAQRSSADPETLAASKAQLVAEQKAALEKRRDEACSGLRKVRDARYRTILDNQREARADLHGRQHDGLDSAAFLQQLRQERPRGYLGATFQEAAKDVAARRGDDWERVAPVDDRSPNEEGTAGHGMRERRDFTNRIGHGVGAFFGALGFDLINLGSAPPPPPPRTDDMGRDLIDIAAEEASKQREQDRRDREDEEWRKRRE